MKRISLSDLKEMVDNGKIIAPSYCYRCKKIAYNTYQHARDEGKKLRSLGKGHTIAYRCPRNPNFFHLSSDKQRPEKNDRLHLLC